MAITAKMVAEFVALLPDDMHWSRKRSMSILHFWPNGDVRAAEQDARDGRPEPLAAYDLDVKTIKAVIPKSDLP